MRVTDRKEVRGDDQIKYFLSMGFKSTFLSSRRVIVVKVPWNKEISGGGKNGGRKEFCYPWKRSE